MSVRFAIRPVRDRERTVHGAIPPVPGAEMRGLLGLNFGRFGGHGDVGLGEWMVHAEPQGLEKSWATQACASGAKARKKSSLSVSVLKR